MYNNNKRRHTRLYKSRRARLPRLGGRLRQVGYYNRKGGTTLERKFHDLDIVDAAIKLTGTIVTPTCLIIATGTTESSRIGRRIRVKQINFRYKITLLASEVSTQTACTVRCILYLDKQNNGVGLTGVTDLLETDDYQSFNNLANSKRFSILMDKRHTLKASCGGGDGTTEDYGVTIVNDQWHRSMDLQVEYSGTDGTLNEIPSNNIGFMLIPDALDLCAFDGKMRVRYTD